MIITVASFKGGVGKTTTAIHLAAYFQQTASTLLIDADPNRSATKYADRGNKDRRLPFKIAGIKESHRYSVGCHHLVLDTEAREEDLKEIVEGCDLLILPVTPDAMAIEPLQQTIEALKQYPQGNAKYRVLLTRVPTGQNRSEEGETRQFLTKGLGYPVFKSRIREAVAFQKVSNDGILVSQLRESRAKMAWRDYCGVGKEIEELIHG
jgi:chromosome partitioning protein